MAHRNSFHGDYLNSNSTGTCLGCYHLLHRNLTMNSLFLQLIARRGKYVGNHSIVTDYKVNGLVPSMTMGTDLHSDYYRDI